jgi:hypothetical protein
VTASEVFCPVQWSDLALEDPDRTAQFSGAVRTDRGFSLKFFGREYIIDQLLKTVTGPPEHQPAAFVKTLVVLTYLIKSAQGPSPGLAGQQAGAFELPGGSLFFTGPHALPEAKLITAFGKNPQALTARAQALGAPPSPPGTFKMLVLPQVEIGCYLNPADDEFPAQINWTFDRNAHFYLPLDTLWGLTNVIAAELAP